MLTRAAALALLLIVGWPTAAIADDTFGQVECDQGSAPGCEAGAGTSRSRPGSDGSRSGGGGGTSSSGGNGCTTTPAERPPGGPGGYEWAWVSCPGSEPMLVGQEPSDGTPAEGAPAISPLEVALMARDKFVLPRPVIGSSPKPSDLQLVRLNTWLHVERSTWRSYTATATAGGITATVTATPTVTTWTMGDGTTVICRGPGTPYTRSSDPHSGSPTCGHTYLRSSLDAPGHRFKVTATITWGIQWTAAGSGGTLPPLFTTATTSFRVAESQAIVTA